jgi:hypothetical protein
MNEYFWWQGCRIQLRHSHDQVAVARIAPIGQAVAPGLRIGCSACAGRRMAPWVIRPAVHSDCALVAAVLAGREQATNAAADACRRASSGDWFVVDIRQNQVTVIGSRKGTNVDLSG